MSHKAPEWLTAELLSESLGQEVTGISPSAAAPPGNNYGSVVTRVSVTLKDRPYPLSVIVKSELTEGPMKDSFEIPATTEHDFYYKFLPEVRKLTDASFAPCAFPIKRDKSVILEDLKSRGFEMADRCKQLDFEHCRLYMVAAAKFHAVSLAVYKKNPELVESVGEEKLYAHHLKSAESYKKIVVGAMPLFSKAASSFEKFQRASRIIADVQDNLWNMVVDAHKRGTGINTLNQGDPWATNMMFRYDANRVVREIKLLDFQCIRFGSPVNDIVMFLWSSANHDVKTSRLQELYKIYLQNFNENLKVFGCNATFAEEDFMDAIRKLSPAVLLITGAFVPALLDTAPFDAGKLDEDAVKFYDQYYNEFFCSYHVPKSLEEMEQAGVFDYLEKCLK